MTRHSLFAGLRIAVAVLATCLLSTAAAAAAAPVAGDELAPGWRDHAKPLSMHGLSPDGRTAWAMPETLARGRYVLVGERDGRVTVIPGSSFDVDGGTGIRRTITYLGDGYGDVMAVPESDLPPAARRR